MLVQFCGLESIKKVNKGSMSKEIRVAQHILDIYLWHHFVLTSPDSAITQKECFFQERRFKSYQWCFMNLNFVFNEQIILQ